MEPTPGRRSLNYGLILLLLALIAYAAIGLTLRVEPVSGDELEGLEAQVVESGGAPWESGARGGGPVGRASSGGAP
jgi:hypothetical protein